MRQDLLLRQRPVILLHLLIMAHPGVQFRVPNQQIRHLCAVSALGVAGQGPGVILFQFVVHPAAIEYRPALFFRILPLHLPQKEPAELGPKIELLNAVIPQHGCVPLEPIQHLSRVGISAYHAGHFQIKGLKGSQLQQKPPDRQIEAQINGRLKIQKYLPERKGDDLRPKGFSAGHILGRDLIINKMIV